MSVILDYEIAHKVAQRMDQSEVAFATIFEKFVEEIKCQLRKGNTVQIAGFGDFYPGTDNEIDTAYFLCDPKFEQELSEIPQHPDKN